MSDSIVTLASNPTVIEHKVTHVVVEPKATSVILEHRSPHIVAVTKTVHSVLEQASPHVVLTFGTQGPPGPPGPKGVQGLKGDKGDTGVIALTPEVASLIESRVVDVVAETLGDGTDFTTVYSLAT